LKGSKREIMEALNILIDEHVLIRQFLDNLNRALRKMEQGKRPPREFFDKAVSFARDFTDKYHHFKEEYILFNRLAMKKRGKIDAEVDTLKFQHERGRALMGEVARALDGYDKGQEAQRLIILESVAAYLSLLRQHIHREDHIFFPMAEREIPWEEYRGLQQAFQQEGKKMGKNFLEKSKRDLTQMGGLFIT
jgi:hemerythrin-like domain-containing protein